MVWVSKTTFRWVVFGWAFLLVFSGVVSAEVIFESATMGAAGQTGGVGINVNQYLGARFVISQRTQVTAIGGHLTQWGAGDFFGTIVKLTSSNDMPNGSPFNGSDIMASTVFDPGFPSSDFREPNAVVLEPGDYALIFGTDALGSSGGVGAMPTSGQTILGSPSFILWNGSGWFNAQPFAGRFVVEGVLLDPNEAICTVTRPVPHTESFESGLGNWTNLTIDNFNWTRRSGSTPTTNTGPTGAHDGNYYLYTEASGRSPGQRTVIESPCLDLTSLSGAEVRFWYNMVGVDTGNMSRS